jgi:putative membrane protein
LLDSSWGYWLTAWNFEPSVLLGIAILYGGYLVATGPLRTRFPSNQAITSGQLAAYTGGIITLVIALLSPLDLLSDKYWFNAHMVQHILLTLIAPPLLLLGTPAWLMESLLKPGSIRALARKLTNPYFAFLSFNIVFALWHIPTLYDRALEFEPLHIFEHLTFIATATLTWMPVLSPTPLLPRLSQPVQVLYMFLQSLLPTGLGAVITFAEQPLYTFYVNAPRGAGLSVLEDQVWAGLIMWIGGAFIFLFALTLIFFKWFSREEPIEGQGFI